MGEGKKTDCHTGERVTGVAMAGDITGVVRRRALGGFLTRYTILLYCKIIL